MKKRILSLCLALCFLCALLPVTAVAAQPTVIQAIDISYTAPVIGEALSMELTITTNPVLTDDDWWVIANWSVTDKNGADAEYSWEDTHIAQEGDSCHLHIGIVLKDTDKYVFSGTLEGVTENGAAVQQDGIVVYHEENTVVSFDRTFDTLGDAASADAVTASSEEELLALFAVSGETLDVNADVTITGKALCGSFRYFNVAEGVTVTIANGGTLRTTIDNHGTIVVQAGGTLASGMGTNNNNAGIVTVCAAEGATAAGVLVSQAGSRFLNSGTLNLNGAYDIETGWGESTDWGENVNLYFEAQESGVVTGDGTVYMRSANEKIQAALEESFSGCTVKVGSPEDDAPVTGLELEVSSQAELADALSRTQEVSRITVTADCTLTADCTIQYGGERLDCYHDCTLTIPEGVTVTLADGGVLGSAWYSYEGDWETGLMPEGQVKILGAVVVEDGGVLGGDVTEVSGAITVKRGGEAVLPNQVAGTFTVEAGGSAFTSQGGSCGNSGVIDIQAGAVLTITMGGTLVNNPAGRLNVDGSCIVGDDPKNPGSGKFLDAGGTLTGSGSFTITSSGECNLLEDTFADYTGTVTVDGTVLQGGTAALPELPDGETAALLLNALGLFNGTSDTELSFELDRAPTRVEALVMFLRVLGEEDAALSGDWSHPFTDVPAWADAYVGYAYEMGYTNGVRDTQFGTGDASANMYLTFLLRAFGYDDAAGDFSWDSPNALAAQVGFLTSAVDTASFRRADVALTSCLALGCPLKDSAETLAGKLIDAGAFTAEAYAAAVEADYTQAVSALTAAAEAKAAAAETAAMEAAMAAASAAAEAPLVEVTAPEPAVDVSAGNYPTITWEGSTLYLVGVTDDASAMASAFTAQAGCRLVKVTFQPATPIRYVDWEKADEEFALVHTGGVYGMLGMHGLVAKEISSFDVYFSVPTSAALSGILTIATVTPEA